MWTKQEAEQKIYEFNRLNSKQKEKLLKLLNERFPLSTYQSHLHHRRSALDHQKLQKNILSNAAQEYPDLILSESIPADKNNLKKCAIVFTAGGDGERLRISLEQDGETPKSLKDFTKATYALPGFYKDFGTLHINLAVLGQLAKEGIHIPVIVTTGPQGSVTSRVIPQIIKKYDSFGIKTLIVIKQEERIHFTQDEQIVYKAKKDHFSIATHPDESGGPLMKLKTAGMPSGKTILDALKEQRVEKILVLQGTAIYKKDILYKMAAASKDYDALGLGIVRKSFPESDPFGTYVCLKKEGMMQVSILEKDVRNEETRKIQDSSGSYYLPYNTGFYAFDLDLLRNSTLPDYATPPKEIHPDLEKSPKVGYAATDILPLGKHPAVLAIDPASYIVLKTKDELPVMSEKAREYGLLDICGNY